MKFQTGNIRQEITTGNVTQYIHRKHQAGYIRQEISDKDY
jgi:hypothetical protein